MNRLPELDQQTVDKLIEIIYETMIQTTESQSYMFGDIATKRLHLLHVAEMSADVALKSIYGPPIEITNSPHKSKSLVTHSDITAWRHRILEGKPPHR